MLTGVELSEVAIARGRERFPHIEFRQGLGRPPRRSARPGHAVRRDPVQRRHLLSRRGREERRSLAWIHDHLKPGGLALVAAWCPGGQYLEPAELRRLLRRHFRILHEQTLPSQHAIFAVEPPAPRPRSPWTTRPGTRSRAGEAIDWEADVFGPCRQLLDRGGRRRRQADPDGRARGVLLAARERSPPRRTRWRSSGARPCAVATTCSSTCHPNWLPVAWGPPRGRAAGSGTGRRPKADDYPGDLGELVAEVRGRCSSRSLRPEKPDYRVTCFRAGAYQAQPFRRLHAPLWRQTGSAATARCYAGGRSRSAAMTTALPTPTTTPTSRVRTIPSSRRRRRRPGSSSCRSSRHGRASAGSLTAAKAPLIATHLLGYLERQREPTDDRVA